MGCRLAVLLAWTLACASPASAQGSGAAGSAFAQGSGAAGSALAQPTASDGVGALLTRLGTLLQQAADREAFRSVVSATLPLEQAEAFGAVLFTPGIRRAVATERDRAPLESALPGDGYRLIVEIFIETAGRARIVTAALDVRRPAGGGADSWRLVAAKTVNAIEGLYRLRVSPSTQFAARDLTITAEDLRLTLEQGTVFVVESEDGVTGLILFGRGAMRFTPAPQSEKGQLRIFAGSETLSASFDSAFVRLHPSEYEQRVSGASLTPAPLNPRELRRAQEVFTREGPKHLSLDLGDLSGEPWYLLPQPGDFVADIRTRRHGTLTYSRTGTHAEDITLFDRDRRRTISLYPSVQRQASSGASYNEDDFREYDVLDYNIDADVAPDRKFIDGRARMRLRTRAPALSSLTLRLSEMLVVTAVTSAEYGRLLHVRLREQDSIIVSLPVTLFRDSELTLVVAYAGPIAPQEIVDSGLPTSSGARQDDPPVIPPEPNFLLSSRAYWYPQNPIPDYATATLRITVPEGFGCVASGQPRASNEVTLRDLLTLTDGKAFVFNASEPLRYFALLVSRFVRVAESTLDVTVGEEEPGGTAGVRLAIEANPRQQALGRAMLSDVEDIMRFYAGLLGEAPYASATIALAEHELPGGHSPGYFAVVNIPLPFSQYTWRNDPASFSGFPEFFLAHELAHQWWGQAVGWRNYHEQWLSEGVSQYFAALYARHARGERVFLDMLRQFRRWSIAEQDQGPIYLGYRLGHIKAQPFVFRALVYNKGAAVLHMLRRLVGDETFFSAIRRFYTEQKFKKAGTNDLQHAFEAESGRPLGRFFDRWIYGAEMPRVRYSSAVGSGAVRVQFEQLGELIYDIPVTVTITYLNGRTQDVVVPVTERRVEWQMPAEGAVRRVQINRDHAALAEFDES